MTGNISLGLPRLISGPPVVPPGVRNPYESPGTLPLEFTPVIQKFKIGDISLGIPKPISEPPVVPPGVRNPYESPGTLPPVFAPATPYVPPVVSDPYVQPVPETNLLWIIGIIILFIFMMR